MYRFKQAALCIIALAAVALAGCTSTAPKADEIDAQRSALQRWNACLDRNANPQTLTAVRINKLITYSCEGHKRDVIATFPPSMATQIDQLLIASAYKMLESNESSVEITAVRSEQTQALLR